MFLKTVRILYNSCIRCVSFWKANVVSTLLANGDCKPLKYLDGVIERYRVRYRGLN